MTSHGAATSRLDLVFGRRGGQTTFERRLYEWPFVLTRTFQLDRAPPHLRTVILQTSAGAIHGVDRLELQIRVRPRAAVYLTTQGASSVHRARAGLIARESVSLIVEPRGFLEYLPEPRILFPDAALDHVLDLDCAPSGSAIVSDAFTVHDPIASRRGFRHFRSVLTVHRGGDLTAADRADLTGIDRWLRRGWSAFGTIAMLTELDPERQHDLALSITRSLASVRDLYGAGSVLPDDAGVAVRLAGRDLRCVRAGLGLARGAFRTVLFGNPGSHRVDAMKLGLLDHPAQTEVDRSGATGPPRADHTRLETSDPVDAACPPTRSSVSTPTWSASTREPRPAR